MQENETLWKIAQKYGGVDFEELIAANQQISNPDMIMPGMKIKVPTTGGDKKQQTAPSKKDKQEVKPAPQPQNQILPEIKEDEEQKWEPLKKEMPSLPIHFNKQQPAPKEKQQPLMPVQPTPGPDVDLKWTQFNKDVMETNINQFLPVKDQLAGAQEMPKPEMQQPMMPPHHHHMPMPHHPCHAPCVSQDGIPYGFGNMGPMQNHPFPDHFGGQVMGQQTQMPASNQQTWQPNNGMNQGQWGGQWEQQMPHWQPMQQPNMQQGQMPQQDQVMSEQQMMPMYGMPNNQQMSPPQYGMPPQPMMPQYGQNTPHYPQAQPYGYHKKDCGCGNREG